MTPSEILAVARYLEWPEQYMAVLHPTTYDGIVYWSGDDKWLPHQDRTSLLAAECLRLGLCVEIKIAFLGSVNAKLYDHGNTHYHGTGPTPTDAICAALLARRDAMKKGEVRWYGCDCVPFDYVWRFTDTSREYMNSINPGVWKSAYCNPEPTEKDRGVKRITQAEAEAIIAGWQAGETPASKPMPYFDDQDYPKQNKREPDVQWTGRKLCPRCGGTKEIASGQYYGVIRCPDCSENGTVENVIKPQCESTGLGVQQPDAAGEARLPSETEASIHLTTAPGDAPAAAGGNDPAMENKIRYELGDAAKGPTTYFSKAAQSDPLAIEPGCENDATDEPPDELEPDWKAMLIAEQGHSGYFLVRISKLEKLVVTQEESNVALQSQYDNLVTKHEETVIRLRKAHQELNDETMEYEKALKMQRDEIKILEKELEAAKTSAGDYGGDAPRLPKDGERGDSAEPPAVFHPTRCYCNACVEERSRKIKQPAVYEHHVCCSASRHSPRGCPGCSCVLCEDYFAEKPDPDPPANYKTFQTTVKVDGVEREATGEIWEPPPATKPIPVHIGPPSVFEQHPKARIQCDDCGLSHVVGMCPATNEQVAQYERRIADLEREAESYWQKLDGKNAECDALEMRLTTANANLDTLQRIIAEQSTELSKASARAKKADKNIENYLRSRLAQMGISDPAKSVGLLLDDVKSRAEKNEFAAKCWATFKQAWPKKHEKHIEATEYAVRQAAEKQQPVI